MREYIEIKKSLIPYDFDISIAGKMFNIKVNYNKTADMFTVRLSKVGGEVICAGEPLVYGMPLWRDVWRQGEYPQFDVVPYDESNEKTKVTWDNLNETVFLVFDIGEERIVK